MPRGSKDLVAIVPYWIIALLSDFQLAPLLLSGLIFSKKNIEGRSVKMNITDVFFNAESEKAKTFQIAGFLLQKLSG